MTKKNSVTKNFYELLEVSPRAREEVIHAAYRTLMKIYGPDQEKYDKRVAQSLNEAKDVLADRRKRKDYDSDRENLKGKIVGNYKVLEMIAEGGFGKTYIGEQLDIRAPVCIKHSHLVSAQDEEVLIEEARAIWDLRHYGIPAMRDVFRLEDKSLALVMSYIPGLTLEQVIEKKKKLDPEHVAWIAERSLNVLKYLHYHGVVHGDVKPQNIIVQSDTHNVVLVDYGLSAIRPTSAHRSKGYTPFFAAPEQEDGKTLLPESDFYGLGMTMIYALGGDVGMKKVPTSTPDEMCGFIKGLIVRDVLERPSWEKLDLVDEMQKIREKSFGRRHSNMLEIGGLK